MKTSPSGLFITDMSGLNSFKPGSRYPVTVIGFVQKTEKELDTSLPIVT